MIITTNNTESIECFENLLQKSKNYLEKLSVESPSYFLNRDGTKFEVDVSDSLQKVAIGTPFEKTIKLYSGGRFPDILIKNYFGVEVKTTTQNHWQTTGNSIFESTRIEDAKEIFLYFAKLTNPINIKFRRYEDCLSDIVVTHSPRYRIDMNLSLGETIFDKVGINYENLRILQNPFKPISQYYRDRIQPGDELWWLEPGSDTETDHALPLTIRLWKNLSSSEKRKICIEAFIFFPEIFRSNYDRVATWLINDYGVISPSLRDTFSAGGRVRLPGQLSKYGLLPRVLTNFYANLDDFLIVIRNIDPEKLKYNWKIDTTTNRIAQWLFLVKNEINPLLMKPLEEMINSRI